MKPHYFVLPLLLFGSCQQDDLPEEPLRSETNLLTRGQEEPAAQERAVVYTSETSDEFVTIGDSLINAYTVDNMRNAVMSLFWRKPYDPSDNRVYATAEEMFSMLPANLSVKTTHRYVAIGFADWSQYAAATEDWDLILLPLPANFEVSGRGAIARAPAEYNPETGEMRLTEAPPTCFAVIPINRPLPSNRFCTVLENLYIPELLDAALAEAAGVPLISKALASLLTDQSMYLSGSKNLRELTEQKEWTPEGRVRVFDSQLSDYVGVPHVRVYASDGYQTAYAYTDTDGNFRLDRTFRGQVRYSIEWQDERYRIFTSNGEEASYYCGKWYTPLDLMIPGGTQYGIATVWRALYTHYYGENIWDRISNYTDERLRVIYLHEYSEKYAGYFVPDGNKSFVTIYGLQKNLKKGLSTDLLKTTFHELGHAAMYFKCRNVGRYFDGYDKVITESWAALIGWHMMYAEYDKLGSGFHKKVHINFEGLDYYFDFSNSYNKQKFSQEDFSTADYSRNYTPLFIDCVDDSNQRTYYRLTGDDGVYPDDRLVTTNYSLLRALGFASYTLTELKANLLDYKTELGYTEEDINDYFEFYGI